MKAKILNINEIKAKIVPWGTTKLLINSNSVGAENLEVRITEVPPGKAHELHKHDVEEVFIVLSGKGTHMENGTKLDIAPNDVIYVPAGASHRHECTGNEPLKAIVIFAPPTQSV
jgi:mannose-6-phosphate isomerase-like protein (cupin superfamily)